MFTFHTGIGGFELFEEEMEKSQGFYRVYIGKKIPRILKDKYVFRRTWKGIYYRLFGNVVYVDSERYRFTLTNKEKDRYNIIDGLLKKYLDY